MKCIAESITEVRISGANPLMVRSGKNCVAAHKRPMLSTKENIPPVSSISGKARILSTGLKMPFIIPIIAPASNRAGKSPLKEMLFGIYWGISQAANKSPKAFSGIGKRNRNMCRYNSLHYFRH